MKITDFDKEEYRSRFWEGTKNKSIRYYYYVQQGLILLNEARYLIMGILAIYAILKLNNYWLMPIMFILTIPFLGTLGYVSVHHMQKTMEFLNIQFTTHFSRYNINLQEEQLELLRDIKKLLEKK